MNGSISSRLCFASPSISKSLHFASTYPLDELHVSPRGMACVILGIALDCHTRRRNLNQKKEKLWDIRFAFSLLTAPTVGLKRGNVCVTSCEGSLSLMLCIVHMHVPTSQLLHRSSLLCFHIVSHSQMLSTSCLFLEIAPTGQTKNGPNWIFYSKIKLPNN